MPPVVRACVESWSRENPAWDLTVLTGGTLAQHADPILATPEARRLLPYRLSDLARLSLLLRHGGVWVDATVYCTRPLDGWLPDHMGSGFFAFDRPGPDRLLSNWLLAAPPDGYVPQRMWEALSGYYLDHGLRLNGSWRSLACKALSRVLNRSTRTTAVWFWPPLPQLGITPYFAFHYTFARLARSDPQFAAIWSATPKITADGPHSIQHPPARDAPVYKLDWRQDQLLELLPPC